MQEPKRKRKNNYRGTHVEDPHFAHKLLWESREPPADGTSNKLKQYWPPTPGYLWRTTQLRCGPCTKMRLPQIFPDRFRDDINGFFRIFSPDKRHFWRFTDREAELLHDLKIANHAIYCVPKYSKAGSRTRIPGKEFPGLDKSFRNVFRWFSAKDRFGRDDSNEHWYETIYTRLGGKDE